MLKHKQLCKRKLTDISYQCITAAKRAQGRGDSTIDAHRDHSTQGPGGGTSKQEGSSNILAVMAVIQAAGYGRIMGTTLCIGWHDAAQQRVLYHALHEVLTSNLRLPCATAAATIFCSCESILQRLLLLLLLLCCRHQCADVACGWRAGCLVNVAVFASCLRLILQYKLLVQHGTSTDCEVSRV